jgi:hypothetical protein
MTTTTSMTTHLHELSDLRDRMHEELEQLDRLILRLDEATDAGERNLAKFKLGEKLGATKLSRLLGCSRNHAIKHLETTFADRVNTQSNGYRWVPRSVVEEWLSDGKVTPLKPGSHTPNKRALRTFKCDRCGAPSAAVTVIGEGPTASSLEFCGHHLVEATQLASRGYEVLFDN